MLEKSSPSRGQIVSYIEATLVQGKAKPAAYREFIDSSDGNVKPGIRKLESSKEFKAIAEVITTDADREMELAALKVRRKYISLMDRSLDAANNLIDAAVAMDKREETTKNTAMAIRLSNETIQAMGNLAGAPQPLDPAQPPLDYSGIVKK